MYNLTQLQRILAKYPNQTKFVVAYSGGLDSHVLLHSMSMLKKQNAALELSAIYVNHGISPNAQAWQHHCQTICDELQIPLIVKEIPVKITKNLEAELRAWRYRLFATALSSDVVLVTAHHQNDQVETFFLQLLRGAGPNGLAAMPERLVLGPSYLLRPFLTFSRSDLMQYAQLNQLKWIEDESNSQLKFDRNYIRHEVLPIIQKRWPSVLDIVNRSITHCAAAAHAINSFAQQQLTMMLNNDNSLQVDPLLKLKPAEQNYILRAWLEKLELPIPDTVKITQIQNEVLAARFDRNPCLKWSGVEVRRFHGRLLAFSSLDTLPKQWQSDWDFKSELTMPAQGGYLKATLVKGQQSLKATRIIVRFRQGGERFHPAGRIGSHPLKKLFQEWQVPPWQRERIPLLYIENELAMVVGYGIDERFIAKNDEEGVMIEWITAGKRLIDSYT